jgi:hypothetical protein
MVDPKAALFQAMAKMLGVSPDMLNMAVATIATAGERLERIEGKINFLMGLVDELIKPADGSVDYPGIAGNGLAPDRSTGAGANGAVHEVPVVGSTTNT